MTLPPPATPDAARMTDAPRVPALDGVRGIAILLVLTMHGLYVAPLLGVDLAGPLARTLLLGWCGVDVFFVLSGFLITGILLRSKGSSHYFRNFYARRALRIFPLYYAVIALLLWVLPRPPAPPAEQWSYLLYYQNFRFALSDYVLDPARLITWSLAIEEQFYLVWPALVYRLSERRLRQVCVLLIAAAIALRFVLLGQGMHGTHFLTPCRMDALALGALLAMVPAPRAGWGWTGVLAGTAILGVTAWQTHASVPESVPQQRWGLLGALAFGGGLLVLARSSAFVQRVVSVRLLQSFGAYSYCIYLVHLLVIEFVSEHALLRLSPETQSWLRRTFSPAALLAGYLVLFATTCWLVAFASWHLFEKWLLRLKRHFPSA